VNHDEFLQLVYDHFRREDAWPRVRELQVPLRGRVNVRLLAAEIGPDLVVCEDGTDGVCFLRLEALARCASAHQDIEAFLAAVRFIAQRFIEHGPAPVTSEALARSLKLDSRAVRRLGLILFRDSGSWMGGGNFQPDGSTFSINPREPAMFFEDVRTLDGLFEISRRVAEEEIATARARFGPRGNQGMAPEDESLANGSPRDHMKVLISWSGDRSHKLAILFHDWLPSVIQAVQPYVSSENIQKGTRWPIELAGELEQTDFGILCIVPNNLDAPWLNFEAGALSKIVKKARVVPLLFGGRPSALAGHPLGQFQAAVFEKSDVLKTLKSMNELLGSTGLSEKRLEAVFEQWWPKLVQDVEAVSHDDDSAVAPRLDRPSSLPAAELSETEQKILAMWAKRDADLTLLATHVVGVLGISEQQARFYLDELTKKKYLHDLHAMGRPTKYTITHKGREFLVRANLT
jgi:predicted transcriptional regulator